MNSPVFTYSFYSEDLLADVHLKHNLIEKPANKSNDLVLDVTIVTKSGMKLAYCTLEISSSIVAKSMDTAIEQIEAALVEYLTYKAHTEKYDAMYDGVYREH